LPQSSFIPKTDGHTDIKPPLSCDKQKMQSLRLAAASEAAFLRLTFMSGTITLIPAG